MLRGSKQWHVWCSVVYAECFEQLHLFLQSQKQYLYVPFVWLQWDWQEAVPPHSDEVRGCGDHQAGSASSWHFLTIHVATKLVHSVLKRNAAGASGILVLFCHCVLRFYFCQHASSNSWAKCSFTQSESKNLASFGQLYLAIDCVWILSFWKVGPRHKLILQIHISLGWQLKSGLKFGPYHEKLSLTLEYGDSCRMRYVGHRVI